MKVGDLIRIYDPDENTLDGETYWTIGILTDIKYKSPNPESYRIFSIYSVAPRPTPEGHLIFDEPYWAAEVISSVLTD